jgi:hypothetical protein
VLENFAHEEAAKALILIDAVRCPAKLISSKLNKVVGHFYDHLARLIYAEAQHWRPMHMKQLREYVDQERRAHYLEGYAGEYILPNSTVARRESVLYADIEAYENDALVWNIPHSIPHQCQIASNRDPLFASNVDPPCVMTLALSVSGSGLST